MTQNWKLHHRIGVLFMVQLIVSITLVFGREFLPLPLLIAPFSFGFTLGLLTFNLLPNQVMKSMFLGLLFLAIFLCSSFGMLVVSKTLFGTDDFLPFLSTPFSVLLIIFTVNRFQKINNKTRLFILMVVSGLIATFTSNWFDKNPIPTFGKIFVTLPFLWQTSLGILLLQGIDQD